MKLNVITSNQHSIILNKIDAVIRNKQYDLIICSTSTKAKKIAKTIIEKQELEIMFDDRLRERNYGEFEGLLDDEYDVVGFWEYGNKNFNNAECLESFVKRVYSFLDEVIELLTKRNVLIITSADVNIVISTYIDGYIPINLLDVPAQISNEEVIEYEF